MKFFSDLRLTNTQLPEQITALILTGVAAVIIGGVGHMNMRRAQQLPVDAALTDPALPATPGQAVSAVVTMTAPVALEALQQTLTPDAPAATVSAPAPAEAAMTPMPLAQASPLVKQAAAAIEAATAKPEHLVRVAELGRGDTFASLLADADLDDKEAGEVMRAVGTVYKLRKLPRGLEVSMRFTRVGEDETFDGLTFQAEPTLEINVARLEQGGFKAEKVVTPLERQRYAVSGKVNSSLYEAGAANGVPRSVMAAMIRAFSHEIDFQRDMHPGDKFRVLYDQPHSKSGQPVGESTIIFAELTVGGETRSVYRVVYGDGTSEYFNSKGESVRRGLMRTPVDGARLSSAFGMRRHPILGYSKFHKGLDYAAAVGTPIYAAGDGVIQEIGYKSGYGRFILLKHSNGLATAYGHMSRFARGMADGSRVRQGDVIAYVGQTGRATGPHLHFEVRVDGQAVNPMSVEMHNSFTLQGKQLAQFMKGKDMIEQEFKRVSVTAMDQAKPVKLAATAR